MTVVLKSDRSLLFDKQCDHHWNRKKKLPKRGALLEESYLQEDPSITAKVISSFKAQGVSKGAADR